MAGEKNLISNLDRAASLPVDAPHILEVDDSVPVNSEAASCVIDVDEFEDALRDPEVATFAAKAIAYRRQVEAEGRGLTGTADL